MRGMVPAFTVGALLSFAAPFAFHLVPPFLGSASESYVAGALMFLVWVTASAGARMAAGLLAGHLEVPLAAFSALAGMGLLFTLAYLGAVTLPEGPVAYFLGNTALSVIYLGPMTIALAVLGATVVCMRSRLHQQ